MEKPDSEGYIHVKWPSKSVPHGGIFHIRKAEEPTPAKTQFLKGLIEESRLAAKLRQKDVYNLRQQDEKVKNTKPYQAPLVRPRTSRRRSLSVIRESGAYETNAYRPLQRGEDREKLKDKLANTMAYGDNEAQFDLQVKKLLDKPKPKLPTKKDTWHDLMTQIRERAEFLAEMEYLGQGVEHREVIEDQIAERMRALQALGIDSECASVRSMMTDKETKKGGGNLMSVRSNASQKSGASNRSKGYQRYSRPVQRKQVGPRKREENILAYNEFPPLEYSPRRRL